MHFDGNSRASGVNFLDLQFSGFDLDTALDAVSARASLGARFAYVATPNVDHVVALAGEPDRTRVLKIIQRYLRPEHRIFIGVVSPIDPLIESPKEIRDRVLEAARYIPVEQLGTTDDCGFSPFCDDTSTTREKAFAKIRSRVEGTALAEQIINGR